MIVNLNCFCKFVLNGKRLGIILLAIILLWGANNNIYSDEINTDQITAFPGRSPICPRWALEPWVWEDNGNTRQSTEYLVEGYLSRNIPVGVVIVDSPWSTKYNNFVWDTQRYPEPQKMIDRLHARDVRVILWMTGYINNDCEDYELVKAQGFAVDNGREHGWWKGKGVHLDFTNPAACAWWRSKLDNVQKMGIDGWKCDFGASYLGKRVKTSIGEMDRECFRRYYYAGMYSALMATNPMGIIMSRPFSDRERGGYYSPISVCTVGWSGDFCGNWECLKKQLDDLYYSATAGYGTLCVEVGGYDKERANKEQLIRYAQFGALMPIMNNGGVNGGLENHLPWFHDEETVDIYRYYATLHSELVPYIFSYGVDAHLTGLSIVRGASTVQSHHCLGEDIFVSPIIDENNEKRIYFPPTGTWIDYWDEAKAYPPGAVVDYKADLHRYPIFIRAGAIIPLLVKTDVTGHGDNDWAEKETILLYPYGRREIIYHRPISKGVDYKDIVIRMDEKKGEICVLGPEKLDYRLCVKSFTRPQKVSGAKKWRYDENRRMVIIDKYDDELKIHIKGLLGYSSYNVSIRANTPRQKNQAARSSVWFWRDFHWAG
ncbi:MAG: hypothetical protein JW709_00230, partial [Sedimentisphaerales bacterium]|nr:hypothetical protein [Sedimentisphaerales bacterium]